MNGGQRRTLVLLFKHSNKRFLFSDPGLEEDRWARKRKEVVNNRWKRKIIGVVFDKGRKTGQFCIEGIGGGERIGA